MPFTMHDLRRTAATHLEALGCPLETIKAILNHASAAGLTRLYARSDPLPRMREWLGELDAQYAAWLSGAVPADATEFMGATG